MIRFKYKNKRRESLNEKLWCGILGSFFQLQKFTGWTCKISFQLLDLPVLTEERGNCRKQSVKKARTLWLLGWSSQFESFEQHFKWNWKTNLNLELRILWDEFYGWSLVFGLWGSFQKLRDRLDLPFNIDPNPPESRDSDALLTNKFSGRNSGPSRNFVLWN